ncbi:MAG: beta-ketoacyl-ACP synthase II [Gammaproteobacteria bacterium]|mgnify:CR=1 FL=1|jgi:3-oxoacyl-[acyl-carrier-protein] synthase II|nr:beta-ketoacyl-ACP synthase II [Gammaproteobacteria bacterium]MBT7603388.1 beta-ketoacyl-ACP synthase II [Gammaproteobacteria bacterium]
MTDNTRRVVITGLGLVTPVGSTVNTAWDNIKNGVSGIRKIDSFDASSFSVQISGSVIGFNVDDFISAKEQRKMDTFIHYGIGASAMAIKDSGIEITEENSDRIGVSIGSGIGGLPYIERNYGKFLENGPRKISPFFVPSSIINMVSGNLSIMYGITGPNMSLVSACATGTHSIGDAARLIKHGYVDCMIAGGAEMATCPLGIGGFASAKALCSTNNDDPEKASRPWDINRNGFVLGDGAGIVVMEDYEHAKKRGAKIYCEIVGFGMNSDAHHMTQPAAGGLGASKCMKQALKEASLNEDQINYINAHGTSTPAGDKAETDAIKSALGIENAKKTPISSTKSMIGHLLGAAGGVEAVFCILAIKDNVMPPTINLNNQDPECDLDYIPNTARESEINIAMSNSFGFGGTNGTLIFKRM